ncbi:Endoglucanase cel12A [Pleurostoma richardsiae]|uniref:Endoglucanase cel12A n=1 Tax=Pleurostoma richardsiae TaxID=41990 RepID=A0AA38SG88_9PEZI|nr:Endoglucanase cel12A [Pleurostoma richardsiae]
MRPASLALLAGLPAIARARDALVCGTNGFTGSGASENLTYAANAYNSDGEGYQCLAIVNSPPSFDATWSWVEEATEVHSFPHVTFLSSKLPVAFSNISSLTLTTQWGYGTGNSTIPASVINSTGLRRVGATANVAFDMFADPDVSKAANASTAATEVMIWIGSIGSPWPIGYSTNRTCFKQAVGDVEFILYQGQNSGGTNVFSWVAATNETVFNDDISPLLQYLWRNDLVPSNSSLGLIEFGSEAYHAGSNVTFSASNFSLELHVGKAPKLDLETMPKECAASVVGRYPLAIIITMLAGIFVL